MKGFLALLLGGFGLAAWLQRRRRRAGGVDEASPADELRERLAESRAVAAEPEPEPEAPDPPDLPDPAARRRELHERARAELDELA